jgi:hypothetical protein
MTASPARETFKTNVATVLTTFSTANPTYCRRVFRARPSGSPDYPYAFIDRVRMTAVHDAGTRRTTFDGLSFVLVFEGADNPETALLIDQSVDALLDHLSDYPQMGGTRGIWSTVVIEDEEQVVGDYLFPGVRFTFPDLTEMVGRS